ncbi:hypothetical protein J1C54_08250 [Alcanivorax sp. 1008]|nr:hypothetical protein [Alcanivorax sp. 1008]
MIIAILATNILIILASIIVMAQNAGLYRMIRASQNDQSFRLQTIAGQLSFIDGKIPPREIRDRQQF